MNDDNVVEFKKAERPDLIWVCGTCGCTTHRLYSDGRTSCAGCEKPSTDADDACWRERLPATPEDPLPLPDEAFKVVPLATPATFLQRRLREGDADQIDMALLVYVDGRIATYWDRKPTLTDEDRAKVRTLLDEAYERITVRP